MAYSDPILQELTRIIVPPPQQVRCLLDLRGTENLKPSGRRSQDTARARASLKVTKPAQSSVARFICWALGWCLPEHGGRRQTSLCSLILPEAPFSKGDGEHTISDPPALLKRSISYRMLQPLSHSPVPCCKGVFLFSSPVPPPFLFKKASSRGFICRSAQPRLDACSSISLEHRSAAWHVPGTI